MTEQRTVHLDDPRVERMEMVSTLADLPAAVLLLGAGLGGIADAGGGAGALWPAAQALAGAALLGAMAREALRMRRRDGGEEDERIGWVEVAAAAMLAVEGVEGLRAAGEAISPAAVAGSASLVAAAFTFLKGMLNARLQRRRREGRFLRTDAEGIVFRRSRIRGWSLPWERVARVEVDGREARVVEPGGRVRRIPLRRYRNADEAAALLREAARRVEGGAEPRPVATTASSSVASVEHERES